MKLENVIKGMKAQRKLGIASIVTLLSSVFTSAIAIFCAVFGFGRAASSIGNVFFFMLCGFIILFVLFLISSAVSASKLQSDHAREE